jgi:hypothetical protein
VIVLDYNITKDQAVLLGGRRTHFQQVGVDIGLPSWDDQQEILRYLHQARQVTFFTRDADFFRARLCHRNYCLVVVDMAEIETAHAIRRFLRHPAFRTKAQRCGKVVKLSPRQITWWEAGERGRHNLIW